MRLTVEAARKGRRIFLRAMELIEPYADAFVAGAVTELLADHGARRQVSDSPPGAIGSIVLGVLSISALLSMLLGLLIWELLDLCEFLGWL